MSLDLNDMLLILVSLINIFNISNAGCPFAAMMNNYNFSGDWSYNASINSTSDVAYVMHICHFENQEIYFTLAKNNSLNANDVIGFGSGNWSQSNMMIGGQVFEINNGSTSSHGFGIGMNMEVHKWWIQDPYRSQPLHEGKKIVIHNKDNKHNKHNKECAIPYGILIRRKYFQAFWDSKRKFHRQQRIEKRRRDRERKKKLRAEKKKPIYVKYYEKFLDFIGFGEAKENNTISDAIINAKFIYEQQADFPTLFGSSWINDNGDNELSVTFIDKNNGCFNGELFSNISVAYYGVGINSFIEKPNYNGIRNGQFFIQIEENTLMGSSITFKLNDNGEIIEDEIKEFTMQKADKLKPCSETKIPILTKTKENPDKCGAKYGEKCEL